MDAKLVCFLFALISLAHCMEESEDYDYLASSEVETCSSSRAAFYYIDEKGPINVETYVKGKHSVIEDYTIKINATNILFVDDEKPDTIWGGSPPIDLHLVLYEKDIHFDWIVVDPVTNNIYFADNNRGIGVCSGHGSNTSCTLLISKASNVPTIYRHLILYWQHGVMFWIQIENEQNSEVKMASMNGHHVRILKELHSVKGLALDSNQGYLHASRDNKIVNFNVQNHSIESKEFYAVRNIFFFNCLVHSFERQVTPKKEVCRYTSCYNRPAQTRLKLQKVKDGDAYKDHEKEFLSVPAILVFENDRALKTNPCNSLQCAGICTLAETLPEPLPECIAISSAKSANLQVNVEVGTHFLNYLVTLLVAFFLLLVVALLVSPQLRSQFRECFARLPCKKSKAKMVTQEHQHFTVDGAQIDVNDLDL